MSNQRFAVGDTVVVATMPSVGPLQVHAITAKGKAMKPARYSLRSQQSGGTFADISDWELIAEAEWGKYRKQ